MALLTTEEWAAKVALIDIGAANWMLTYIKREGVYEDFSEIFSWKHTPQGHLHWSGIRRQLMALP